MPATTRQIVVGMAKLFSKTQPAYVDPDEIEVDAKIRQLEARRVADTMEIVALEKRGVKIEEPDPRQAAIDGRVALLLGETYPAQPNPKSLADLYADRDAIDIALVKLRQLSLAAHGEIVARRCAERLPQWRDLVRQRALAVATLRRLNRECDEFIADLASGPQRGGMAAEFPAIKLGGYGNNGADFIRYLEAAVRAGIVTERDLQNA